MPTLSDQIDALHDLRERIAGIVRQQGERELEGRVLRLTIETELRTDGTGKTEAEKLAKSEPRYVAHERASIQFAYDRAVLEAQAEAARFEIELQLAVLRREAVGYDGQA